MKIKLDKGRGVCNYRVAPEAWQRLERIAKPLPGKKGLDSLWCSHYYLEDKIDQLEDTGIDWGEQAIGRLSAFRDCLNMLEREENQ